MLAVAGMLAVTSLASAQTRVGVRPAPKPGEIIHVTAEQQILLRIGEHPEEPGPAYLQTNNSIEYTQRNGTYDAQGRMEAQITLERVEFDEEFGGSPRKTPDTTTLKDRVLSVTLDRSGKLVGMKVPPDLRAVTPRISQLIAGAYGMINLVPDAQLAVGEETTMSSELPMRIPGNVGQAPLTASSTVTLRGIDKGPSRIAHLQQAIDVSTATSQVKVEGGGTVDVDVDRGFVAGTNVEWRISGTMPTPDGAQAMPPFFGSIKVRVNAH
jgi:hypothetical protein